MKIYLINDTVTGGKPKWRPCVVLASAGTYVTVARGFSESRGNSRVKTTSGSLPGKRTFFDKEPISYNVGTKRPLTMKDLLPLNNKKELNKLESKIVLDACANRKLRKAAKYMVKMMERDMKEKIDPILGFDVTEIINDSLPKSSLERVHALNIRKLDNFKGLTIAMFESKDNVAEGIVINKEQKFCGHCIGDDVIWYKKGNKVAKGWENEPIDIVIDQLSDDQVLEELMGGKNTKDISKETELDR